MAWMRTPRRMLTSRWILMSRVKRLTHLLTVIAVVIFTCLFLYLEWEISMVSIKSGQLKEPTQVIISKGRAVLWAVFELCYY